MAFFPDTLPSPNRPRRASLGLLPLLRSCNVPATWFALKDKTNCTFVQQLLKDNHGGPRRALPAPAVPLPPWAWTAKQLWARYAAWLARPPGGLLCPCSSPCWLRLPVRPHAAEIAGHTLDHMRLDANLTREEVASEWAGRRGATAAVGKHAVLLPRVLPGDWTGL